MAKWVEKEVNTLMGYAHAADEDTMVDLYEHVHHMMYKEGNHPEFPARTLSAVTSKIRQVCNSYKKQLI